MQFMMRKRIIISLVFVISISLFIKNNIDIKKYKEEEKTKRESIEYIIENNNKKKELKEKGKIKKIINYEIIIEIPKINLKKGIYKKDDINNNVDKNVTILNESKYPDQNGNIFIAAHSGRGKHSYFNNLTKLKIKDKVILYYKKNKYLYKLNKIDYIDKIEKNSLVTEGNNNLILITCSQKYKNKYLILTFLKE